MLLLTFTASLAVLLNHGNVHFLYQLRCKYVVLESSYPKSELEAYGGALQIDIHDWKKAPVVSLCEAAKSANPCNAYYGAPCNCKRVALESSALAERQGSHAPQDAIHELSGC